MLIKQLHQKSIIFVTIAVSEIAIAISLCYYLNDVNIDTIFVSNKILQLITWKMESWNEVSIFFFVNYNIVN